MSGGFQQRLVFGRDRDPGVVEEGMTGADLRTKDGALRTNPMLALAGAGPDGAKCGTCSHLYRVGGVAGRYYKCDLRRVSGGPATDHRVRWPACGRYEPDPEP